MELLKYFTCRSYFENVDVSNNSLFSLVSGKLNPALILLKQLQSPSLWRYCTQSFCKNYFVFPSAAELAYALYTVRTLYPKKVALVFLTGKSVYNLYNGMVEVDYRRNCAASVDVLESGYLIAWRKGRNYSQLVACGSGKSVNRY